MDHLLSLKCEICLQNFWQDYFSSTNFKCLIFYICEDVHIQHIRLQMFDVEIVDRVFEGEKRIVNWFESVGMVTFFRVVVVKITRQKSDQLLLLKAKDLA